MTLPAVPVQGWSTSRESDNGPVTVWSAEGTPLLVITVNQLSASECQVALVSTFLEEHPGALTAALLLDWAENFVRSDRAEHLEAGQDLVLRFDTTDASPASLAALFESKGFTLTVAEDEMALELPEPRFEDPRDWQTWSPATASSFFTVYEAAFRDRPGFPGWDESRWQRQLAASPHFRPELSILLHDDGEPAAFAICWVEQSDGWIVQMGVRPSSRGRGLGKALLASATARFQRAGATRAMLSVNVNNPGAAALYRSFGFERVAQYRSYRKQLG